MPWRFRLQENARRLGPMRCHFKNFGCISLGLLTACGGRVEQGLPPPPPDAGSLFDVSPDSPPPPGYLQPLPVPEGWVVEAIFYLDDATEQILPGQRCDLGSPKTVWVSRYSLMRFEVTRGEYKQCVDAGACQAADGPLEISTPPDEFPAAVSYPQARTFCGAYGGDLPTYAEWDRAAAGNSLGAFGVAKLTASWLKCQHGDGGTVCDELDRAVPDPKGGTPALATVGSHTWDLGPYGHSDLYGNAEEWVRTPLLGPGDPQFCALPNYGPDPATFAKDSTGLAEVRQMGELLRQPRASDNPVFDFLGRRFFPWAGRNWDAPKSFTSFRCAFPSAQ